MEVILAGTYLILNSIIDIKKREVSIKLSGIFAVIGLMVIGMNVDRVMGILLGLLVVAVAKIYKQIGMGDGIAIVVLGLLLGIIHTLNILLVGSMGASLVGLLLLMTKKRNAKQELPFIPFLLLGLLVGVLL